MIRLHTDPTRRELRWFAGLWLPLTCGVVGLILVRLGGSWTTTTVLWAVAAALGIAGLIRPGIARPVFVGWMVAVYPIGWVVSHLFLLAIFFLVVTPMGIVLRLFGRDPLQRRIDRDAPSYWIARPAEPRMTRYFRQF